jgi:hypothetical protein
MSDKKVLAFTEAEFREVYKDIFALGMKADELDLDPEQVDLCCDGWLAANQANFQLEKQPYYVPNKMIEALKGNPVTLITPDTGLGDDIQSDIDRDEADSDQQGR